MRLFILALLLLSADAFAARVIVSATGAGPISDDGRALSFDLSAVQGEIKAARLVMGMNYSQARELSFRLIDNSGVVILPLSSGSAVLSPQTTMVGEYTISDDAFATWQQAQPFGAGNLPPQIASRAWQAGQSGQCLNLLARFLEFDIDRASPLTLQIDRQPAATPGSGSISGARLIIDTDAAPDIFRAGFDGIEPGLGIDRCQRQSFDLAVNSFDDPVFLSPISLLSFPAGDMAWSLRQYGTSIIDAPDIRYGTTNTLAYPGRFGGRSRMNLGFWDPVTGVLNFTTGAGTRTLELPGDWLSVAYRVIPGDYDGDGITDLAVAYLADQWIARIRFSRSDLIRDYSIDPRVLVPDVFASPQIGYGYGQDSDFNGTDEITIYAQSFTNGLMRLVQVLVNPSSGGVEVFHGPSFGVLGDRMVLGRWTTNTSGNQFGLVTVRRTVEGWEWRIFANPTVTLWGAPGDFPVAMNTDGDQLNDFVVYRPSDRRLYVLRSRDGVEVTFDAFGPSAGFVVPLGYALGTTAPLEN